MDSSIRVLHVTPVIWSGGVEMRRSFLASGLDRRRFVQKIACFHAGGEIAARIRASGMEIIELGGKRIWHLRSHRRLRSLIREWQPHIIHGPIFEGSVFAGFHGHNLRVPVVIREETSDCTDHSTRSRPIKWLMKRVTNRSDAVVGVSEYVGQYLVEREGVPPHKLRVIWNSARDFGRATDEDVRVERSRLGIPEDAVVIGSVGRVYNEHKRFSDLIEALELLSDQPQIYLLVVGQGPHRPMLEELAERLGVADRVIFTGYRFDHQLFLSIMDVFALVSSQEAFGVALAEAMFSELPCIVSRVGALPAVIEAGVTGFVVPSYNPPAIAEAIRTLANDPERRAAMGQAGRQRAIERFSVDRYVRDVEKMYLELLAAKGIEVAP